MKKCLIAILALCSLVSLAGVTQMMQQVVARKKVASGATDYTQDANCVAAYYLNAGLTTNETDRSGEDNTLTASAGGTGARSSDTAGGYSGYSRIFASADTDYLYITTNNMSGLDFGGPNQEFAVAAWINPGAFNAAIMSVAGRFDNPSDKVWELATVNADVNATYGAYFRYTSDGSTIATLTGPENLTTGAWHHIAASYDDTEVILYVDGSPVGTNTYSSGIYSNSIAYFQIGANQEFDEFEGLIDEVIVFDRSISDVEVAELYSDGIDGTKGATD